MSFDTTSNPTAKVKQPTFGNIPLNTSAKSKRGNQKFFDSAEWAMQQDYIKHHGQCGNPKQGPPPTVNKQIYSSALPVNNLDESPIVV